MQFFRLPKQFREHVSQYKHDKQSQLNNINDLRMDTQLKFKKTNNKIEQANNKADKTNQDLSKYKQRLNNYKKANNKKINALESKINLVQENQKSILDTMNMFSSFFTRMFGGEFNNTKDESCFNGNKFSHLEPDINKNNKARNKIQYINSNKKNNSMLRRTNSCFFSINVNDDDNRNNNSNNNSFTVFNRKGDIVPNLEEEDIKENNK